MNKPGYQTSEFWVTCGVQITALITAFSSNDTTSKLMAGIVAAVAIAGYIASRHTLKAAVDGMQPEAPPATSSTASAVPPSAIPPTVKALAIALLIGLWAASCALAGEPRDPQLKPGDAWIPKELRPLNLSGQCVWCAGEATFLAAGFEPFRGLSLRAHREGWAGPNIPHLIAYCRATKTPVTYQLRGDGPIRSYDPATGTTSERSPTGPYDIVQSAIANGTGCYVEIPGHALVVVGLDDTSVRVIDNNPPLTVQTWSRAAFNKRWEKRACFPTVNLRLAYAYRAFHGCHYLYRGEVLVGVWNPATEVWWAWDGVKLTVATPPWK